MSWWESFFDADYLRVWSQWTGVDRTRIEADALWEIAGLAPGARVLDAPCGYGRIARLLADKGALVLGVDQSEALLAHAEATRGDHSHAALRYVRRDLREPLADEGFDVALNVFSSIGYGTQDDDLSILTTIARALRPGGKLVLETMHRDALAVRLAHGNFPGHRGEDGTLLVEEPRFDAIAGRMETTWHWTGPGGSGSKSASIRIYCLTELAWLVEHAGLRVREVRAGLSAQPYRANLPTTRIALIAERA